MTPGRDSEWHLEEMRMPYASSRCLNQNESLRNIALKGLREGCKKSNTAPESLPMVTQVLDTSVRYYLKTPAVPTKDPGNT